jgi:L-fuculose-phosphate aldolase
MAGRSGIEKELIRVGRRVVRSGLVMSTGGNISGRRGDRVYIKSKGSRLDSASSGSYAVLELPGGKRLRGRPSSEWRMHIACYRQRDDINAVIHLHPIFSTAAANSKIKTGPITYELLACLGSELVRARYKPSGSGALAREVAKMIKGHNGVLLPNHGLITVGATASEALCRAQACERACQTLVFSKLLGLYGFLPKREAKRIIAMYGA